MKYAWLDHTIIRDLAPGNPAELYHPDVARHYDTLVPDDAANGDTFANGVLTKRPVPAPVADATVYWSVADIRPQLKLVERVRWDNDKSDEIKTAKIELANPAKLAHTTAILDMLVASADISAATKTAILAKGSQQIPVAVL